MRATGIILNEGKILLIHRFCDGKEYFVCPGGSVEIGENIEEAVLREIKEETNLDAVIDKNYGRSRMVSTEEPIIATSWKTLLEI